MVLYKHGVGFFERFGSLGTMSSVTLNFKKEEMNDVLKSLAVFPQGEGQVVSVSYETPEEKDEALKKAPLLLSDCKSWLDLLRSMRGCQVRLHIAGLEGDSGSERLVHASNSEVVISGYMVGLNEADGKPEQTLVAIMTTGSEADSSPNVRTYLLSQVRGLDIIDPQSGDDLRYVLDLSHSRENQRAVTLFLDRPQQELLVSYVAPTPTWRVSYRLVYTPDSLEHSRSSESDGALSATGQLLIQGWGIVDNQLDEDLEDVSLTLIAGQPISFIYDLYTPRFVERPTVEDETRTVPGPVMFNAALLEKELELSLNDDFNNVAFAALGDDELYAPEARAVSSAPRRKRMQRNLAKATKVQATGIARGELFQYDVGVPITIKRGQSAMVPILGATIASRKQHWFNAEKMPEHPVVTIVATNTTGLTLEQGPATVLEVDNYVGEAVLNFTPTEAEFFVPYAVDLGVRVFQEHATCEETAAIALGQGGYLVHDLWMVRQTTYQIENQTTYPISLVIEQRKLEGYNLVDTSEPMEQTAEFRRWQLPIASRQQTKFQVQERQKISRREQITNLDYQILKTYLRNKFIGDTLFQRLEGILQLHQQCHQLERDIQDRCYQQDRLSTAQKELTEKLKPLQSSGNEGELRQRFVSKIGALEDERDRLQAEITTLEQQAHDLKQQLQQQLQQL
ncbi:hypothetical protein HJG54_24545 [Leptolyngbya sp. NK1-12]|uniref:DUF4139 domain-containing protein n=1 Tax=Leptolyngbya sp. NK1-12 TaxID=2547451 RepID=A0AA96WI17_9CYAN|nr:hypothetical protein [Leptolyngbya sp. NK1-12]WNZ25693.1 hypothetical protein HJG54_24545 [Leptolyngbya sp. NK1-12]